MQNDIFKTNFGQYALSKRLGEPLVVFLSGMDSFSSLQTSQPVIDQFPDHFGVLAVDYLGMGLSKAADRDYCFSDELQAIYHMIDQCAAKQVIVVAHSIAGVYALALSQKLSNLAAFIGIEPTTREIITNPPRDPEYVKAAEKFKHLTQAQGSSWIHAQLDRCFSKEQAALIWKTSEKASNALTTDDEKRLQSIFDSINWQSEIKLPNNLPSVIFTEAYRKKEYCRSEYMTNHRQSQVIAAGTFHYLHWEIPTEISKTMIDIISSL
ncbi:alpha/beta fold hydrolase [Oenococcus sicerae]|uniref:Alpha/beta hydrolase n=1 Tax=Oenococcus sicerae TaxID=2203724 RepID=A0AAJ1RAC6_9LACO|nr:alpha/beta hydrolase [Oenococcus sicerae]MDN6900430.1 alpha/beta hydrolase [Oenococcus sicerae]